MLNSKQELEKMREVVKSSLAARDNIGGTAPKRVEQALAEARKTLEGDPR